LKYHPAWEPSWVVRKGVRLGLFMFSTQWTKVEEQAELIFGRDHGDKWKETLKAKSHNSAYIPPKSPIHLARHVIGHLVQVINAKDEALASKNKQLATMGKELSKYKRQQNTK